MKTFLGMQMEQAAGLIKKHLDHYIKKVVAEYAEYIKQAIRPKKVPIIPSVVLKPKNIPDLQDPSKQKFYRSFVATLQFTLQHHSHMGQIRYCLCGITAGSVLRISGIFSLGSTSPPHGRLPSFKITYYRSKGSSNLISGYADADSRRSTSGTLMLYNKASIMWRSKMQKTSALSTSETKCYSASAAGTEILYLTALLERQGLAQKTPTPVPPSGAATSSADGNEPSTLKHFAHEVIRNGEMQLIKVSTTSQLADILTKGLHDMPQFLACANGILGVDKD